VVPDQLNYKSKLTGQSSENEEQLLSSFLKKKEKPVLENISYSYVLNLGHQT
jgi:hypothetical protein